MEFDQPEAVCERLKPGWEWLQLAIDVGHQTRKPHDPRRFLSRRQSRARILHSSVRQRLGVSALVAFRDFLTDFFWNPRADPEPRRGSPLAEAVPRWSVRAQAGVKPRPAERASRCGRGGGALRTILTNVVMIDCVAPRRPHCNLVVENGPHFGAR